MYYSKDLVLTVVDEAGAKALHDQYNDYYGRAACEVARTFIAPEPFDTLYKDISNGGLGFLVKTRDDGKVIGYASLSIDYVPRIARPYLFLGKEHRNKGYGMQLMAVLLHIAFQEANARKVSLVVYELNPRGQHLYTKMGFKEEGRRREEMYRDGKYWDLIYTGLFKTDWRELWKTLVVDEDGRQLYTISTSERG